MLWTLALKELRDGFRNRWVAAAIVVLGILALVLSVLGSAPTGSVRVSELDISVISLASLSVYLIPLIALMLSYDALVGEFERGTMMLLLAYPVTRWQIIIGKFLGHLMILLIAIVVGFVPGCGPQVLVTTLYINGVIPFAALIGNAISNDGDALFPAIALNPRAAVVAPLYSAVPALVVAYGFYLLAPGFMN